MGASFDNEEKVALLPKQADPQGAQQAVAVADMEAGEQHWDGHLLNCCAGCGVNGWSACAFSYFVPCLAFGHNMKKALRLSFLAQAALFALFFFSGKSLYLLSSQAVVDSCPPLPHHGPHGHHGHNHTSFHHPSPLVADLPTAMMPGSFNASSAHEHHAPHPPQMTPECRKALMTMNGLCALTFLLAVAGFIYAARRRTQIREKFGIAGSRMSDMCSWLWCPLCSLCQETRTIWSNNVHEGVWYGPTQLNAADTMTTAPATKQMEADDFTKPVIAKDFV